MSKETIRCTQCGYFFEANPEDSTDLCECPKCKERVIGQMGSISQKEVIEHMTERNIKQKLLENFKTLGIEGTEMVITHSYEGKTREKLLYYYNELIGR